MDFIQALAAQISHSVTTGGIGDVVGRTAIFRTGGACHKQPGGAYGWPAAH